MYAHTPLPMREGFSNGCPHTPSPPPAAIKEGELRENGVGEIEARIMGERERERERITLKGKAYFKKVRLEW